MSGDIASPVSPGTTSCLSLVYVCQPTRSLPVARNTVSQNWVVIRTCILWQTHSFYYASSDVHITICPLRYSANTTNHKRNHHAGKQNPMFDLLTAKESTGCVSADSCLCKLKHLQLIYCLVSLFMDVPWPQKVNWAGICNILLCKSMSWSFKAAKGIAFQLGISLLL